LPATVTVLVTVPATVGVVTSVIVTELPAGIMPRLQRRIAPRVHDACVVDAETKVLPAGIGSTMLTPVAVSGPLFPTTMVQVMFPAPNFYLAGEPAFVTARSMSGAITSFSSVQPLVVALLFASPEYAVYQ
jgi:hypothetical protein